MEFAERFLTPEGLRDLYTLFLVCVALILFVCWFISYCRRVDTLDYHDENLAGPVPPRFDVDLSNASNLVEGMREPSLFASMDSLRTPLKDYRNPTPPGESMDEYFAKVGVSERGRAEGVLFPAEDKFWTKHEPSPLEKEKNASARRRLDMLAADILSREKLP